MKYNSKSLKIFLFGLLSVTTSIAQPVHEKMDRGVVATTISSKKVYVSWRLLQEDPTNVTFNFYRKDVAKQTHFEKVNPLPISQTMRSIRWMA